MEKAEEDFDSGGKCLRDREDVEGADDGDVDEAQEGEIEFRRVVVPSTRSLSSSRAKGTMSKSLPIWLLMLVANFCRARWRSSIFTKIGLSRFVGLGC